MWAVMGFLFAAAIGLVAVLAVGRRGSAQSDQHPWILYDTAKLHVGIMAGLAGFAFTGIVLVVTLARARPGIDESSLDTVIVMFLVAYLWWVGNAFLISYIPHDQTSGELVPRVHFSLASTIEYRTVFLSWFALLPLLEANGFGRLSHVLYFLLPTSLVFGSVLIAMAADGLGLLRLWETYFSAAIGTLLALGLHRHHRLRAPRRPVPALHAVPRACPLLHQRFGLRARSTDVPFAAICGHQTILQAIRQAASHCRHASDNGFARVPLACCRRGDLNCSVCREVATSLSRMCCDNELGSPGREYNRHIIDGR